MWCVKDFEFISESMHGGVCNPSPWKKDVGRTAGWMPTGPAQGEANLLAVKFLLLILSVPALSASAWELLNSCLRGTGLGVDWF